MTHVSFITGLKRILPESTWPWVFAALHHDPLIWDSLSGEIGGRVLALNSDNPEDYSPAALALIALELPASADHLRAVPMQPAMDQEMDEWEIILADIPLAQAGLLALELREKRRKSVSWTEVIGEVSKTTPTALACLFGMIPHPDELLNALVELNIGNVPKEPNIHLALHALLSNPLTPRSHSHSLHGLIKRLPADRQLDLLRLLANYRPELAAKLSQDIQEDISLDVDGQLRTIAGVTHQLSNYIRSAELLSLENNPVQTTTVLEESIKTTRTLQAKLTARLAEVADTSQNTQSALTLWEQAAILDAESPDIQAGYAIALVNENRTAEAQTLLSATEKNHPSLMLANAVLRLQRGEHDAARVSACQALALLEEEPLPSDTFPSTRANRLAKILLELNLPREAVRASEIAVTQQPNDPDTLSLLTCTWSAAAQPETALLAAHLAVTASPDRRDLRIQLAESQEIAGDWSSALKQRSLIVEELAAPPADELLSLANCAIQAGQPETATQLCQHLLQLDENNGEAYVVLGKARVTVGDTQSALEYLHQATQLMPEHSTPWLELARFYKDEGQDQKALETLHAATHAAPDLPEIHLALGEAHLKQNELTQALISLRCASDLIHSLPRRPNSPKEAFQQGDLSFKSSLRLGQTLHQLGHVEEAQHVLEDAYLQAPTYPDLAQSYANILLDLGENRQAIKPLETILSAEPEEVSPYLDYAHCLLKLKEINDSEIDIERAIPILRRALEINPGHPEATILLAEALAANHELLPAMDAYNKAMDTNLAQEPSWQIRFSLGLGQVALKLGQVETAVAALQEAYQTDPTNPRVLRSLSEAYNAAGLLEDAFQTAHTALSLAPGEVESLVWFATQVENLQSKAGFNIPEAQTEVINALDRATQIEHQRTDLWVRLGITHQRNGNNEEALNAFRTVAEIQNPSSASLAANLYQAAQGLMELDDAACAVTCLERALQPDYTPASPSDPSLLEILTALSTANFQNGDIQAALDSLSQAIMVAPDEPSLYIDKANMLLEPGESQLIGEAQVKEALSCLETALELKPDDPSSHYRAALILRTTGDIPAALDHAEHLINLSGDTIDQTLAYRTLAADLALAMLNPELARGYLDYRESHTEINHHVTHLDFHYLQAELALDSGEDHVAVNELVKILETAPEEPRGLAIQARLSNNRGDYHAALNTFRTAFEALGEQSNAPVSTLRALAQAALETRQWDTAIRLLKHTIDKAPLEPLSPLSLERAIVLRAEYQRLCQALDVINRAPGDSALDEDAHRDFEVSILEAKEQINGWIDHKQNNRELKQVLQPSLISITRWRARGRAVFEPCTENAQALAEMPNKTPSDVASLVACLRQTGELKAAGMAAREHPRDSLVLIQLALALGEEKPRQAQAAIQAASETIRQPKGQYQAGNFGISVEIEPFILALQAYHFHYNGKTIEDQENALKAIQTALTIWPDEPRWHALAAEIHLSDQSADELTNFETAIPHLEQAIKLEPKHAPYYLTLGQIYLQEGSLQQAIRTIEGATDLLPGSATPWMLLAQAHSGAGDLEQAATYAERAITISPNKVEPILLCGEIDLKAGNPSAAQSRAQAVLRIDPDNMTAMSMMAHALSDLGRPDEALSLLEIALQSAPDSLPLSLEKVRVIRNTKGQAPALQAIRELSERYTEEPVILAFLAEALDEAGESEKAIQAAQAALRGITGSTHLTLAEQAKLHYLLGCSFRRAGQLDQAVHHLSEARRLSPEMATTYLELGRTHQERRQFDQALTIYRQAIAAVPNDYRAYYQIGLALKESKDYLGAEKMLRQAAELAPNEPSIHRMLAAVVALNLVHNYQEVPHDMQISA